MHVLDLDLDCFITGIAHYKRDDGDRLSDAEYPPWGVQRFRDFLEKQCGLRRDQPVKGVVVREHIDIFRYWRQLIEEGKLVVRFEVTHVDAHSDMGMGIGNYGVGHIIYELLLRDVEQRLIPGQDPRHIDSGNFLAFALAHRWISKLNFIYHPKYPVMDDYVGVLFRGFDPWGGYIQLKGYDKKKLIGSDLVGSPVEIWEPEIPFFQCSVDDFKLNGRVDIATISNSPGYTPASADRLLEVFEEYIE